MDIGTNTTRLLVADVDAGAIRDRREVKAFTRLGRGLAPDGSVLPGKLTELSAVVAEHVALARQLGAQALRVVATAAVREAPNREEICAALRTAAVGEVAVLGGADEARLAFLGATRTAPGPVGGSVGVVDVGGGSTEIAVGTVAAGVTWWASRRVGSGSLAPGAGDRVAPAAVEVMRARAEAELAGMAPPAVDHALAVGGSAASLRMLVGPVLDAVALERALGALCAAPVPVVARRFGLEPERVGLLPAGIVLLDAAARRLGRPLRIGSGGLREGVLLELAGAA